MFRLNEPTIKWASAALLAYLAIGSANAQEATPPMAPSAITVDLSAIQETPASVDQRYPLPLVAPPPPSPLPESIPAPSQPSDLLPPAVSAFSVPGKPASAATASVPVPMSTKATQAGSSAMPQESGALSSAAKPATAPGVASTSTEQDQSDLSTQSIAQSEATPSAEPTPPAEPTAPAEAEEIPVIPPAEESETVPEAEETAPEQVPEGEPSAEQPTPEQPATEQPATEQPAPEQPPSEQPATEQPATEQPAEGEPVEAQPAEPDPNQPAQEIAEGGVRIVYPEGEKGVPPESFPILDDLAGRMQRDETLRLQIECYAAGQKETEGKSRRMSLVRCLAVRQYFIDKDIRATRMDIRALGFRSKGQPVDRVDIVPAPEGL
jgi:outer membrane protein OmpA-like peptidoglycan-associated protein